jgi:hypothetical protein
MYSILWPAGINISCESDVVLLVFMRVLYKLYTYIPFPAVTAAVYNGGGGVIQAASTD